MENYNEMIEIPVKAIPLGEFKDFGTYIKNVQECANKYGVNSILLHMDCNGFAITGYAIKNLSSANVYPIKTYLLVQSSDMEKTKSFKSLSSN